MAVIVEAYMIDAAVMPNKVTGDNRRWLLSLFASVFWFFIDFDWVRSYFAPYFAFDFVFDLLCGSSALVKFPDILDWGRRHPDD